MSLVWRGSECALLKRLTNRYSAEGPEAESQLGSQGRTAANLRGIVDADELEFIELQLLERTYATVLIDEFPQRVLSVDDLLGWHRAWLGSVYEWAGSIRTVNVSKDGFLFARCALIPTLLEEFERSWLARFTPCTLDSIEELSEAIATVHVELILIHPFRDGNGRIARLLADVMSGQGGRGLLDYSSWDADKESYFAAIRAGQAGDYRPMAQRVREALGA